MSKKKGNKKPQNKQAAAEKHAAKKAAVLGTDKKKSPMPLFAVIAVGVLLAMGAFFVMSKGDDVSSPVATVSQSPSSAGVISYAVDRFEDGRAKFFSYKADDDLTIKYFILKSSDGVIRAAFDACDVCWQAGKGYYQAGDVMVCRNCGREFASVLVNEVKGGCNPAPLRRTVEKGKVVIRVTDILEGKLYFDFNQA